MNTPSNPLPDFPLNPPPSAPATAAATRPFYWSVRRELWEHRSIYVALLAVAGVALVGFVISLLHFQRTMRELPRLTPGAQHVMLAMPYAHVAMLLALTMLLVGLFYSQDALYGERRDRSILFWKSLPVSDLTIVLSKAFIPLVVLPLLAFVIIAALHWLMLLLSSFTLLVCGGGAAALWETLPFVQIELVLLYSLAAITLWYAPIYCWLLLVSGWARRATLVWAVLPPVSIGVFELIAFHTSYFGRLMGKRLFGFAAEAFNYTLPDGSRIDPHFIPVTQLTPGRFLASPGLWIGLILAAGFFAAAVRMRRYREPI
jgi:ABC-2 type transport system permease protein